MHNEVKFSSRRLMLTLMLCACSVILLQNHSVSEHNSFTANLLCMLAGLLVCAAALAPSIILKKRYDSDVLTLIGKSTPRLKLPFAVLYALYFTYVAASFLLTYTDLFCDKYYPGVSPCIVGLCLLGLCVYAAYKGVNIITRIGVFLFAFALLTNLLLFTGSASSLELSNGSFAMSFDLRETADTFFYFCTPAFIAALYACTAGQTRYFRFRQPLLSLLFIAVKYALVLFFVTFSLGGYAQRQSYQTFILSRVAHFGSFAGMESFFISLLTLSVFMIIALALCCINRAAGKEKTLRLPVVTAVILFVINLISEWNSSFGELFSNSVLMLVFTLIVAVVIPAAYIWIGGKKREA